MTGACYVGTSGIRAHNTPPISSVESVCVAAFRGSWHPEQVLCKSVDRSVTVRLTVSVCRSVLVSSACRPASRAYHGKVAS
jgi:hypothetical protein